MGATDNDNAFPVVCDLFLRWIEIAKRIGFLKLA
jgi:hypothetical protein